MNTARTSVVRLAGIAVVAAAAFAAGPANADTFVPLPGGDITQTLDDGTVVQVTLTGESATISPSMGDTPLHRNAWTSGRGEVNLSEGAAADPSTYTKLQPGYVVGCQVDLKGITPGASAGVSASNLSSSSPTVSGTGGGSLSLTLAAGQAKSFYILDLESPDGYGNESHSSRNKVMGTHSSITWKDETFAVDGCGGYAQARSFVRVMIHTPSTVGYVTLWGEPFSIG
ncbi:MspA family porin [Nocardia pseudovaccinii]|uniref:MspA family porin n=1 Tax=Nocardia pseudovaccinii TaxID=189540 RepID=UPI0007A4F128|nr:MspA family porin [Nocardia pseudovaccinii]